MSFHTNNALDIKDNSPDRS